MACIFPTNPIFVTVSHISGDSDNHKIGSTVAVNGTAGCTYGYDISFAHYANNNHALFFGQTSIEYYLYQTSGQLFQNQYITTAIAPGCDQQFNSGNLGVFGFDGTDVIHIEMSSLEDCNLDGYYELTLLTIDDVPICWSITGIRKNGRKWQRNGPNRLPDEIRIPKDVDPDSCIVIEDGYQVPKDKYRLIQ